MKKLFRKFINKYGYDIVKTAEWSEINKHKKIVVPVGSYSILMPANNPQVFNYVSIPNLNEELAYLAQIVANKYSDAVLIDVGANVGDTVAVVKSKINIPIIAIEGDATSYSFLQENVKQFENITTINNFLGEQMQTVPVDVEKKGWNNTIIPNNEASTTIQLNTLDNILADHNLSTANCKLLKIDTEGFDTIILRGCYKLLSTHKPVLYIEYNAANMQAIGEDGFTTLLNLTQFGYHHIFIFDGLSNLLFYTHLNDKSNLAQLNNYLHKKNAIIPFFDICIMHANDEDICHVLLNLQK